MTDGLLFRSDNCTCFVGLMKTGKKNKAKKSLVWPSKESKRCSRSIWSALFAIVDVFNDDIKNGRTFVLKSEKPAVSISALSGYKMLKS